MAITVIKRGVKPEDQVYRGTCGNCSTEVECKRSDGTYYSGTGRLKITCPVCYEEFGIYKKVPEEPRRAGDVWPEPKYPWQVSTIPLGRQMADSLDYRDR